MTSMQTLLVIAIIAGWIVIGFAVAMLVGAAANLMEGVDE